MRIAVIAPPYKPIPLSGYGGIERVIHSLVEQLVASGHEVTLFAVAGSRCSGSMVQIPLPEGTMALSGLRRKSDACSEETLYQAMLQHLGSRPVDVIHDWSFQNLFVQRHPERVPFLISTCIPPEPGSSRPNLVACSRAHASLCGGSTRFVHYGLDLERWNYSLEKNGHMIHIAKIARYKAQHLAVRASRAAGKNLVLAGNVEDPLYYYAMIKPLLWISPRVSYLGEVQGTNQHLLHASALVQTPRWFDAFPRVVLEALASATPVIAFAEGGIPEQIEPGVNGFLCGSLDEMVSAMENVDQIKPRDCRDYAQEHFSLPLMAARYLDLYRQVCDGERW